MKSNKVSNRQKLRNQKHKISIPKQSAGLFLAFLRQEITREEFDLKITRLEMYARDVNRSKRLKFSTKQLDLPFEKSHHPLSCKNGLERRSAASVVDGP